MDDLVDRVTEMHLPASTSQLYFVNQSRIMRLLNAKTFQFQEFYDNQTPDYVILSHLWGAEEVQLKDFERVFTKKTKPVSTLEGREGYKKITQCAQTALGFSIEWIWVDTICIDKRSSAELSEAINSMYRWYSRADMCVVYLADVSSPVLDDLERSQWFTRGWTLQELLAPSWTVFYNHKWRRLGTAVDLIEPIASATRISREHLKYYVQGIRPDISPSIAQKMSWVSRRRTSRPEDIAYCLLGLFDVNMPLLYGEGAKKAFVRLQTEILKKEDLDDSIFAWDSLPDTDLAYDRPLNHTRPEPGGMLASSPQVFEYAGDIMTVRDVEPRSKDLVVNSGVILQFK